MEQPREEERIGREGMAAEMVSLVAAIGVRECGGEETESER